MIFARQSVLQGDHHRTGVPTARTHASWEVRFNVASIQGYLHCAPFRAVAASTVRNLYRGIR